MLKQRIITALLLIPFVLGGIFYLPASYFAWALVPIFLIAAKEWGRMIEPACNVTQWSFTFTMGLLLVALNLIVPADKVWLAGVLNPVYQGVIGLGGLWWLISVFLVVGFPKSSQFWQSSPMLKSMFGQLTLAPCFAALITLKSLSSVAHPFYGGALVFLVFLVVWAADSGAYFFGRSLGRRKLMPRVSPGKTLEGLLGGLLTTMIVVALVMYLSPEQELPLVIAVTLLTAIASAVGDLSESMFKRSANIKDSGNILPGHGGVLDRIDSLTAALPVFTLIYIAFWM
ncbi:phosphatidate cytidylyltransferase [Shewanella sp. NFH-SH190041]|uniref:phosphatidate cytidylyltransferase n=1 Tax=Shewanella sp. NFH-SH190041 TaxID=2950245 RepID=UPI0021C2FB42|nr:phosphatidate cytidylyltransferase [Shewanella sp. NFH-SH190041]BDM65318.1 phosphatidate cytidylyltransferase [Shewanella sp. NFH-SH190041]